jgi:hypothetical protein
MQLFILLQTNFLSRPMRVLVLWLLALCAICCPVFASTAVELRISAGQGEYVEIALPSIETAPPCLTKDTPLFDPDLGIKKISDNVFRQPLNSEASEDAVYLKAARMGQGIYMYLPYFKPVRDCQNVIFHVEAKHILWNGKWYAGRLVIAADAVRLKALFFTNEATPLIKGASYFDSSIPEQVLPRLDAAFQKIITF